MRNFRPASLTLILTLFAGMFFISPATSFAQHSFDDEVASFSKVDAKSETAGEEKRMYFIRSSRRLVARLQEQKASFMKKHGHVPNRVATKVEDLINEANLMAAQDNYEDGMQVLVKAHKIVMTSIKDIASK